MGVVEQDTDKDHWKKRSFLSKFERLIHSDEIGVI